MKRAAGVVVATLAVVAAASAKPDASPQALYRTLLTSQYRPLPAGYSSAKVGTDALSDKDKRHHAVGAVLVNLDSGDGLIGYTVYPTLADVAGRFREPTTRPEGVRSYTVMGTVPGFGRTRSRWINGTIEGNNVFGKKVRNGITVMYVQRRNVIVAAATVSTDNESSGDVPGTIRLMRSALAHLGRVAARLG
jgi:hypothetical protein